MATIITPSDTTVGGWLNSTHANISVDNGIVSTNGGLSYAFNQGLPQIAGFSQTSGGGNYGYYEIDLGQKYSNATLSVDMFISVAGNAGQGYWNIVASSKQFGQNNPSSSSNCFGQDAAEIWSTTTNPSYGQIFTQNGGGDNAWLKRQLVSAHFNGRYIYIGAVDLNQGALGISLHAVSAYSS